MRIRRAHQRETMSCMEDREGTLHVEQEGIKKAVVEYWENIMRRRDIDLDDAKEILDNITDTMPLPSQENLGLNLNERGGPPFENFISCAAIKESIQQNKLAKWSLPINLS